MVNAGIFGRLLQALMLVLLVAIVVVSGLDYLARRGQHRAPFERVSQAAGLIALTRAATPEQRGLAVYAAASSDLHLEISDAKPAPAPDDIRAPALERVLARLLGAPVPGLEAYTDAANGHALPGAESRTEGKLTKAFATLDNGRTLTIQWRDAPRFAPPWFGFRSSALVSGLALTLTVFALASLFGFARETGSLRRLVETVSTFDGRRPAGPMVEEGAPDVRRLTRAVAEMQGRVAALLSERSFLIGAISHDLKTYLTRLKLRAESLADEQTRDRMLADLDTMTELIDASLAFARGTATSDVRNVLDLGDLVAVEVEERNALGPTLKLVASYANGAVIEGDPVALRRVVCNLLDNAMKFGRSTVAVRVERTATQGRVVVEDDGPGIPEAERIAVLSAYYRVDRSRNRRTGGTGLGLAIARQIVEAHGGTIEVGPRDGGGASVQVALPMVRT